MLFSTLQVTVVFVIAFIAGFASWTWQRFFSYQGLPKSLPWAGANGSILSRGLSAKRSFFGLKDLIQDGYYKVRSNNIFTPVEIGDQAQDVPLDGHSFLIIIT